MYRISLLLLAEPYTTHTLARIGLLMRKSRLRLPPSPPPPIRDSEIPSSDESAYRPVAKGTELQTHFDRLSLAMHARTFGRRNSGSTVHELKSTFPPWQAFAFQEVFICCMSRRDPNFHTRAERDDVTRLVSPRFVPMPSAGLLLRGSSVLTGYSRKLCLRASAPRMDRSCRNRSP